MTEIKNIINNAKKNITVISDNIYQQKINEALQSMNELLNCIADLSDNMTEANNLTEDDKQKYLEIMKDALAAMENKDYILMADVLQYDMMDLLAVYEEKLS